MANTEPKEHVPYVHLADASDQDYTIGDGQFPGLHNDLLFLWAMVDCEDGNRYELIRSLSAHAAYDVTLHVCSTDLYEHPTNIRFPGERDLYLGPLLWFADGDKQTIFPFNTTLAEKHPLSVSLGPHEYVWKEDDVIDVVLTPLPNNVTTIYVPGLPDDVGYTSSGCTVSGSVNGSTITGGYGGLDRMYCIQGISAMSSKIARLEHYWFVWAAEFEDGTIETGNAMLGEGNYATATFRRPDERPVIATNDDVHAKVVWETEGDVSQPTRASLSFGDRTWDFDATHNAANSAVALGIAWMHGTVQEQGGPTPVRSWSTMEVIKIRAKPRD